LGIIPTIVADPLFIGWCQQS